MNKSQDESTSLRGGREGERERKKKGEGGHTHVDEQV